MERQYFKTENMTVQQVSEMQGLLKNQTSVVKKIQALEDENKRHLAWLDKMIQGGETVEMFSSSHDEINQAKGALLAYKSVRDELLIKEN